MTRGIRPQQTFLSEYFKVVVNEQDKEPGNPHVKGRVLKIRTHHGFDIWRLGGADDGHMDQIYRIP